MEAWVAVIGALGGAIIGAGITWLIERDRRKFERESRWVDERRAIYAAVISSADAYYDELYQWFLRSNAAHEKRLSTDEIGKWPDIKPFEAACYEAELLAPIRVLRPLVGIRNVRQQVARTSTEWQLGMTKKWSEATYDEQNRLFAEYDKSRDTFVMAVRDDLGVAPYAEAGLPTGLKRQRPRLGPRVRKLESRQPGPPPARKP